MKIGKAIKDEYIKVTKKILKNILTPVSNNSGWEELNNTVIKITAIRKYKNSIWSNTFLYEVDVICDMRYSGYLFSTYYNRRNPRRANRYYRCRFEKSVRDELKYFGVGMSDDVVVKNIKYQVIE